MTRRGRPLPLAAMLVIVCGTSASGRAAGAATSAPTRAPASAPAPSADDKAVIARGEALFDQHCSGCHEPAIEGAPSQADLGNYSPQAIVDILRNGAMQPMAKDLTDVDVEAVNRFLHAY